MDQHLAQQSTSIEETTEPVILYIMGSANAPFGFGTRGPVNMELVKVLKSLRSPNHSFTRIVNWFKAGKLWAHLKPTSHPGFCTLGDVLADQAFIDEVWNNQALVERVVFVKDKLYGQVITEEEAVSLNRSFDPEAQVGTAQAPRKRSFPAASASAVPAAQPVARRRLTQIADDDWSAPQHGPPYRLKPFILGQRRQRLHTMPFCPCDGSCFLTHLTSMRPFIPNKMAKLISAVMSNQFPDASPYNPTPNIVEFADWWMQDQLNSNLKQAKKEKKLNKKKA